MQPNVCAADIFALQFQWSGSAPFELCLDDVSFTTAAGTVDPGAPSSSGNAKKLSVAGGGCGCRNAGGSAGGAGACAVLALLGLWVVRRRAERVA
jgi:MYXO-CTERM domain-containing protein